MVRPPSRLRLSSRLSKDTSAGCSSRPKPRLVTTGVPRQPPATLTRHGAGMVSTRLGVDTSPPGTRSHR